MEINVNFGGFYCSYHETLINEFISYEEDYFLGEFEDKDKVKKYLEDNSLEFWQLYHYQSIYVEYSKFWLQSFKDWLFSELDLKINLDFINLSSPKYYNYSTDVIISETNIKKHEVKNILYNDTFNIDFDLLAAFEDRVSQVTTSVSGYTAFYDYDNVINMIDKDNKRVHFECFFDALIKIFNNDFFIHEDINESLYDFINIDTKKHNYND